MCAGAQLHVARSIIYHGFSRLSQFGMLSPRLEKTRERGDWRESEMLEMPIALVCVSVARGGYLFRRRSPLFKCSLAFLIFEIRSVCNNRRTLIINDYEFNEINGKFCTGRRIDERFFGLKLK